MTECTNGHSEKGNEKEGIWKCEVCNGEHKISLKPSDGESSHAKSRANETSRTTGHGEVSTTVKPDASKHETTERPTTRSSSAEPE